MISLLKVKPPGPISKAVPDAPSGTAAASATVKVTVRVTAPRGTSMVTSPPRNDATPPDGPIATAVVGAARPSPLPEQPTSTMTQYANANPVNHRIVTSIAPDDRVTKSFWTVRRVTTRPCGRRKARGAELKSVADFGPS